MYTKQKKKLVQGTKARTSDVDPDPWIQICTINVGSRFVWRDTNPNPGHTRSYTVNEQKHVMAKNSN